MATLLLLYPVQYICICIPIAAVDYFCFAHPTTFQFISFHELQKKHKRKEKGNRKDRSALLNDDPLANGDEDDDVARMAREMEEKYV